MCEFILIDREREGQRERRQGETYTGAKDRERDREREERHKRRLTFVGNVVPSPFTTISLVIPPGRDIVFGSACACDLNLNSDVVRLWVRGHRRWRSQRSAECG